MQPSLKMADWREFINNKLLNEQFIQAYCIDKKDETDVAFFSALIPNAIAAKSLKSFSWDLYIGDGQPGCNTHFEGKEEVVKYHRFGGNNSVEPLVIMRDFHDIKPSYLEVSEEFRLFHNIFFDAKTGQYLKFDDSGIGEEAIRIGPKDVRIRRNLLRQFLGIKDMQLALFFDIRRFSKQTLREQGLQDGVQEFQGKNFSYSLGIGNWDGFLGDGRKSLSRLCGKIMLDGLKKSETGFWPYEKPEKHEDFIIGQDEAGNSIVHTSDPDKLSNYFSTKPGAAHYLTPVFFRREVLGKYYGNSELYSVEDGYLRCAGLWGLHIDNNHEQYVVVFLGDLGRDLPQAERSYWKSFNVLPEGKISAVNFKRSFLAQFTDPTRADLCFKHLFESFQKAWIHKYGWSLFKPLSKQDEHCFTTLRIPLNDSQSEFDNQVLSLAKIIIDSLNEDELAHRINAPLPRDAKGITKLEKFLEVQGAGEAKEHIKFLRSLWDLRHGAGHRKGTGYEKAAQYFNTNERDLRTVFQEILDKAIALIKFLGENLPKGDMD